VADRALLTPIDVRDYAPLTASEPKAMARDVLRHGHREYERRFVAERERRDVEQRAAAREKRAALIEGERRDGDARQHGATARILHQARDRQRSRLPRIVQ